MFLDTKLSEKKISFLIYDLENISFESCIKPFEKHMKDDCILVINIYGNANSQNVRKFFFNNKNYEILFSLHNGCRVYRYKSEEEKHESKKGSFIPCFPTLENIRIVKPIITCKQRKISYEGISSNGDRLYIKYFKWSSNIFTSDYFLIVKDKDLNEYFLVEPYVNKNKNFEETDFTSE